MRALLRAGLLVALSAAFLSAQVPTPVPAKAAPKSADKQPAPAPVAGSDDTNAKEPTKLEAFTVTGSHIARVDSESPAPVITYSAVEIADKGYATLGEFVSNLSFNSDQTNSEITLGSFVAGAGTSNPRGLGSNRFLTLINGRRGVPYALTNGINGSPASAFNFNSIPAGAVDRTIAKNLGLQPK